MNGAYSDRGSHKFFAPPENDSRFRRVSGRIVRAAISGSGGAWSRASRYRNRALYPFAPRYGMGARPRRVVGSDPDVSQGGYSRLSVVARPDEAALGPF